jgi:AcrR family transcriptional regulator
MDSSAASAGRPNQRRRTRQDLLRAASDLMKAGRRPSLEEVAEAALVSRATAYRYFPSIEALMVEASLDVAFPDPREVLAGAPDKDAVARLEVVDRAMDEMIRANEAALRTMLAHTVQPGAEEAGLPRRQNRRAALIDAALEPASDAFRPADLARLKAALGVLMGTESMVAFRDVLQLDFAEAAEVRRWAIRVLTEAACEPSGGEARLAGAGTSSRRCSP